MKKHRPRPCNGIHVHLVGNTNTGYKAECGRFGKPCKRVSAKDCHYKTTKEDN